MDAAAISPSWRWARLCGAALGLAAACFVASLLLGSDRASAAEGDESSDGLLSSIVGTLETVTTPVVDTVAGVTDAVAKTVSPVTDPIVRSLGIDRPQAPAQPAPAPAAPAPAPATPAPAAPETPADQPLTDLTAPVVDLVDGLPVVGDLLAGLGVTPVLTDVVGAADGLVTTVDTTVDGLVTTVDGVVEALIPGRPIVIDPATPPLAADDIIASSRAEAAIPATPMPFSWRAMEPMLGFGAAAISGAPSASADEAPGTSAPPGGLTALFSVPTTSVSGSSAGSALGFAVAAVFVFAAHRAWVRRGRVARDRIPSGPALQFQPSPD